MPAVAPETACTLPAISRVVALCCSTAAEIAADTSSILPMMPPISFIAATASAAALRTVSIWPPISAVALAVCAASVFTSPATTAKPLPASPARAASIVAFSASRLVCPAMLADQVHHVADARGRVGQAMHGALAGLGALHRLPRHIRGGCHLAGDLGHAGRQLLDRGGNRGEVLRRLRRAFRRGVCLAMHVVRRCRHGLGRRAYPVRGLGQ